MRWLLVSAILAAGTAAGAGPGSGPAPEPSSAPDGMIARPLVLDAGTFDLRLTAEINIQSSLVSKPTSLAPDVWWGVLPRWTIGVIHSDASVDQLTTSATFCVRESDISPCDRRYRGTGLDVLFDALDGPLAVAPRLRVLLRDVDPWKPATTIGAALRWVHGRIAISGDPYLRLPLANAALGNRPAIDLPIWLAVQPAVGWQLGLGTGYDGDLVALRDDGRIPLAVSAATRLTRAFELGVVAGWPVFFGLQHDGRHGTVMISLDWRP
ncbi:MAG TPA: hypothetical protein VH165_26870 [Kofleriaceae bacterium]|nr:hypothetical protein [Kofleriaceae bacterium]